MEPKKDIFDKIMELPLINIFNPFYKKYKEGLLYLFFGGCTFFIALISFSVGVFTFGLEEITSNNISWVIAVAFAYITNRTWVFTEKSHTFKGIVREDVAISSAACHDLGQLQLADITGHGRLGHFKALGAKV